MGVYLDSSHTYEETLIETELAWAVLAPGGVMLGDDWHWPERGSEDFRDATMLRWKETTVQKALIRWAIAREQELDDSLEGNLVRVLHGLFLTFTFRWLVRKPLSWVPGPSIELVFAPR